MLASSLAGGQWVQSVGAPAVRTPCAHALCGSAVQVWPWSVLIPWFKRDMKARVRCLACCGAGLGVVPQGRGGGRAQGSAATPLAGQGA